MTTPDLIKRLKKLRAAGFAVAGEAADELERLRAQEVPTVEDINAQRWTGMDGTTAFHLIERHGDDWWHCGRLMEAWRAANSPAAPAQQAGQAPAPAPDAPEPVAPRPFDAVKSFADSVLAMLDERIKAADRSTHPFNDYFGDKPEVIVAAKAQASELREVRTQVRILGDRALVDLMKFRPAISSPAVQDGKEQP